MQSIPRVKQAHIIFLQSLRTEREGERDFPFIISIFDSFLKGRVQRIMQALDGDRAGVVGNDAGPQPRQRQPRLVAGRDLPLLELNYELTTTTTRTSTSNNGTTRDGNTDDDDDDIVAESIGTVLRRHETTMLKLRITEYNTTPKEATSSISITGEGHGEEEQETVVVKVVYMKIHATAFGNDEYEMYKRNDLAVVDRLIREIIEAVEELQQQVPQQEEEEEEEVTASSIICRWIYEPRQIVLDSNVDSTLEYRMTVQFHLDRMPLDTFRSLLSTSDDEFNVTTYWKPLPRLPQSYVSFQFSSAMNLNQHRHRFGGPPPGGGGGFGGGPRGMMMMGVDGPPRHPMRGGGGPPPPFGGGGGIGVDGGGPPPPAAAAQPPAQQQFDDNTIRTQCEVQATGFLRYIAEEALFFAGWVTKRGGTSGNLVHELSNDTTRVNEIVGTSERETIQERMEAQERSRKRKEEAKDRGEEEEEEEDEDGGTPIPVVFPPGVPSGMVEPPDVPPPSSEEAKQKIKDAVYDASSNYDWFTIVNFE